MEKYSGFRWFLFCCFDFFFTSKDNSPINCKKRDHNPSRTIQVSREGVGSNGQLQWRCSSTRMVSDASLAVFYRNRCDGLENYTVNTMLILSGCEQMAAMAMVKKKTLLPTFGKRLVGLSSVPISMKRAWSDNSWTRLTSSFRCQCRGSLRTHLRSSYRQSLST